MRKEIKELKTRQGYFTTLNEKIAWLWAACGVIGAFWRIKFLLVRAGVICLRADHIDTSGV